MTLVNFRSIGRPAASLPIASRAHRISHFNHFNHFNRTTWRVLLIAWTLAVTFLTSSNVFAAGTDTGSSAMSSLQAWMMTWIPIGAALLIIACALGWIAHLIRADFAVRCVVGLIVVGSASYLVALFGIA